MRVLTVPNWSFGRNVDLLNRFWELLDDAEVEIHFLQSDVDHNRTVSAFSGESSSVFEVLEKLCELAFDRIDLNSHVGVHPRIGALDVCPFVLLPRVVTRELSTYPGETSGEHEAYELSPESTQPDPERAADARQLLAEVESFSAKIAGRFSLPVFLYEKSERGRHEADLPSLRKGGFGGLIGTELNPDFGPSRAHPQLGVTVVGVRDFLIALNINLGIADPAIARTIAREVRDLRSSGDHRFLGVRALGFPLASQGLSQVSLNLTLPDISEVDPIIEWVTAHAVSRGTRVTSTELIGVIRRRDLETATRLKIKDAQIVDA